jgi:endonuclease/exonuclease/phosphatase family metal-dependent hydrolase
LAFFCSFVYGHVRAGQRKQLWEDLVLFSSHTSSDPWLILGDFNATLDPEECSARASLISSSMGDFRDCCNAAEICDIPASGLRFTWNKSPGSVKGVLKKLDRVMGNPVFLDKFPNANAKFLPFYSSDHTPALVSFPGKTMWKPKAFKFQTHLTVNPLFLPIIKSCWNQFVNGCSMYSVVSRLK